MVSWDISSTYHFQSLLWFSDALRQLFECISQGEKEVSIPVGFSDALRQDMPFSSMGLRFQSLLGFLMPCDGCNRSAQVTPDRQFQSLLGFLMPCDWNGCRRSSKPSGVSIPVGFSDALRPPGWWQLEHDKNTFQSLLGFLMPCDMIVKLYGARGIISFQSLLGFLMPCDCRLV